MGHGAGVGTGEGVGSGAGRMSSTSTPRLSVRIETTSVREAGLPREVVQRLVQRNRGMLTYCLDSHGGLPDGGTLDVSVRFVITGSGSVSPTDVTVTGGSTDVSSCLAQRFGTMLFPTPADRAPVPATQTLTFAQGPTG